MAGLKFRISTGLKNIIGKELINNDDIAIFELVKNSYDAGARHVKIIFEGIMGPSSQAKILIIDNGDGMSFEDIKSKWLVVGFSAKKNQTSTEMIDKNGNLSKTNRVFAGAKGIGRFSADRLGRFMTMYTKQESKKVINKINLDWKRFERDQEKDFDTIDVEHSEVSELPKLIASYGVSNKGTILEISGLNSNWDEKKLLVLRRYLQRLINPTIDQNRNDFKIEMIAPEFTTSDKKKDFSEKVNGYIRNIVFKKFREQTTRISCKIMNNKIYTEVIDKGNFVFRFEEDNTYSKLNNVFVYVFYLTPAARTSFTKIMGITHREYGSIFLYKNGFRIHPYGQEGNDWMELEPRKGQGYARYLSNREIIGRIELYGDQPGFNETSSRDGGVIKSEALLQLKKFFISKTLRRLEKYVVDGIAWDREDEEKKKTPEQIAADSFDVISELVGKKNASGVKITVGKNLFKTLRSRRTESLPEVIRNLEFLKRFTNTKEHKAYVDSQLKFLRQYDRTITRTKRAVEEELEVRTKETYFLRKASSGDKQVIMNLNHSIKNLTKKIDGYILRIGKNIENRDPIESIIPWLDKISRENKKVKSLAKIVSVSNFNIKANSREDELVEYIKEYAIAIVDEIKGLSVEFSNENLQYHTKFIPLEISTILDNLIDNSIKAGSTKISIRFEKRSEKLYMYFGDNGIGIRKDNEKYLFTRGYSTTSGSGLGIYHVKLIAEEHGGSASFKGNNFKGLGKGATFEVILHKSN